MAGATGLEPATSGVTGRRSNQLSYAPSAAAGKRPDGANPYYSSRRVSSTPEPARPPPPAFGAASRRESRRVVGDEGFEPPTPSV